MPVLLTNENKSESNASDAVQKALNVLDEYYTLCENNNNGKFRFCIFLKNNKFIYFLTISFLFTIVQLLQEAKNNLWSKMRQIFSNIPNFLIFNTVMRLKEDQLQHVMSLNKTNITNDSHMTNSINSREPLTNFEINLMKTKSYFLSLVGKYLSACQERKRLEERYVQAFNEFEDKLLDKVKIFNADTETEQNEAIMRNYVMEYYSLHFNKGENEFIAQQIEMIKAEIENTTKHLENHEVESLC